MGKEGNRRLGGRAAVGLLTAALALAALTVGPTLIAGSDDEAKAGPVTYLVTVAVSGNGRVTGAGGFINCGPGSTGTCSTAAVAGTDVELDAAPIPPDLFLGWGGDCAGSGTDSHCTLATVASNKSVTATFTGAVPTATPTPGSPAAAPTPTPNTPVIITSSLKSALKACKKKFDRKKPRRKCIKRAKSTLSG